MVIETLQQVFGFSEFRGGQEAVITRVLDRKSTIAIFPTGSGKSLCYQLPALLLPPLTLVVSPLLALMKDQIDFLQQKGIAAARLDSTLSKTELDTIIQQAKSGELKILMISVERFRNERFRHHLKQMPISLMVIDEAHCISEWGHNFRPEYLKIPAYQAEFEIAQVLLLTATATPKVIADMCAKFNVAPDNVIVTGFYRPNLFLQVTPISEADKKNYLLGQIQTAPDAPTIVYVTLQKTAEQVAEFLIAHQISASAYHAGMTSEVREALQNKFMAGEIHTVVATIAFGMGIDKADIRRIIHFDLPKSIENYSQEIGRSGRDNQSARCEVLANRDNLHVLENFVYGDTPDCNSIRSVIDAILACRERIWEVKLTTLSHTADIRPLPLKTLLVYLEMAAVIRPKFTRYDDYQFKFKFAPELIINAFQGERNTFVQQLFNHSITKKIWTSVDIPGLLRAVPGTERQRIIAALEYFDEKGWIELMTKDVIDIYEVLQPDFDPVALTTELYTLFTAKETHEIARIDQMIRFFESATCLSVNLAQYFGETLPHPGCGHCSVCHGHPARLTETQLLKPLSEYNLDTLTFSYRQLTTRAPSPINITKFLCGLPSPVFTKLKAAKLPEYGILNAYAFGQVRTWVEQETP